MTVNRDCEPALELCARCGQLNSTGPAGVCGGCRQLDRQPQGEQPRLFTPAPVQLDGQLSMGDLR